MERQMIEAHVTDIGALGARTPSELAMYLRARAWEPRERMGSSIAWAKTVDDDEYEAVQPLEATLRDYAARVRDLLRVIAVAEGRSELDILHDITNVSMDVHSVRTFPSDSAPGMIALDDGVQAFESLRSLVVAAAYAESADEPRAVQPARKPTDVLQLLRDVRIGPSTEGSFVLSVHLPIPPRLTFAQPALFDSDTAEALEPAEPFERRVSLRMYDAVRAAHGAANEALVSSDGLDSFTRAVRRGVSANLCEALVGLGGQAGHPFEVSMSLAAARPLSSRVPSPVRFRRDLLPVLSEVARVWRESVAEEAVSVVGNVVRLHREGTGSGEISIAGTVEGDDRLRRIWMELAAEDYEKAMTAHQRMCRASVRGDLVRRGTRLYMRNPSGFHMIEEDEV
jgi:hypothetical protein